MYLELTPSEYYLNLYFESGFCIGARWGEI